MLLDSPRYLASAGRTKEAKEILEHIRGSSNEHVEREFFEIRAASENTKPTSPIEFVRILLSLDNSLAPHLGRRAWLCLWLQIMASWTGITVSSPKTPKQKHPN